MLKLIAHRGASKVRPENTLESLHYASSLGADAVECDVQPTRDGHLVIFHDNTLQRLAGVDAAVDSVTEDEMRAALKAKGRDLLTFDGLLAEYTGTAPVLLHIKHPLGEAFAKKVGGSRFPIIAGVQSLESLAEMRRELPRERILAFMPSREPYREFSAGGAGIIRLWQQWLPFPAGDGEITPDTVREVCGGEVWVMMWRKGDGALSTMDGNAQDLDAIANLRADGVLLNDIEMGLAWRRTQL